MTASATIIVQARMGSSRLPGKVLKPILGKPMLAHQLERLRRCERVQDIVLATTTAPKDDVLAEFGRAEGLIVFRGSEDDVLSRYVGAMALAPADAIVRITADCPLHDPAVIDAAIDAFFAADPPVDYLSNCQQRTYPRGLDVEVFSGSALERADRDAESGPEREHVTLHLYRHPEKFRLGSLLAPTDSSRYRLTVDTDEDFRLVDAIYGELHPRDPRFGLPAVLELLARRPDIVAINENVEQKHI